MKLSIIIPTYNRKESLIKCIKALFKQSCPRSFFEIIIIDDGSIDGTEAVIKKTIDQSPVQIRYVKQKNKGPAAARNTGIKIASGEILLFIGDDILGTSKLVEEHHEWHKKYIQDNDAILGYVTWAPEINITPFMSWLENGGPQFHYWQIKNKINIDAEYFYTCNISIKKSFLLKYGLFDEKFPYAAYEDVELGSRLKKHGLQLKFNKNAIAYHHHYTSLKEYCHRMVLVGESHNILLKKQNKQKLFIKESSTVHKILSKCKLFLYYFAAKYYERRKIKANIFKYVLNQYYRIGFNKNFVK